MSDLVVLGCGMVTAIGYNAPATLAALRAGVSGVQVLHWDDIESGEPLRGARVSLPHWSNGVDKLADLVAPAIHECLQQAGDTPPEAIPLLIGVAHHARPFRTQQLDETLLDQIQRRLGQHHHPESALFPFDEAGSVHALIAAQRLLFDGRAKLVVVAGVDSFLYQATLDDYIARRRVMTPGNSNGFFPGEAGSAVLLGKSGPGERDELHILGIGVAREEATIDGTKPLRARGLTEAIKQALRTAGVAFNDIGYRLTDLTGEHYKFKEAAFAAGRFDTAPRRSPNDGPSELWHPIEYLGAIGAAILPCLLAQAMHAAQHGYAPTPLALCHLGSDEGERAALVVGPKRLAVRGTA